MVTAITLFGWTFIIGFVVLAAYLTSENDSRNSKVHKDFADYVSQKVNVVYLNGEAIEYGTMDYFVKDVVSNFPAQYEQLEVNEQMKEFAQYNTGFRPVMK